jgi:hypothetical protein
MANETDIPLRASTKRAAQINLASEDISKPSSNFRQRHRSIGQRFEDDSDSHAGKAINFFPGGPTLGRYRAVRLHRGDHLQAPRMLCRDQASRRLALQSITRPLCSRWIGQLVHRSSGNAPCRLRQRRRELLLWIRGAQKRMCLCCRQITRQLILDEIGL